MSVRPRDGEVELQELGLLGTALPRLLVRVPLRPWGVSAPRRTLRSADAVAFRTGPS